MIKKIKIIILTFNSENIIKETISRAQKIDENIIVIDSYSTDNTTKIANELGAEVIQREFKGYSEQRNWSIDYFAQTCEWQFHLDADEVIDENLAAQIKNIINQKNTQDFYLVRRIDYFMGEKLKHSGLNSWHLRLFKSGTACCEHRLYDQHFVALNSKSPGKLKGFMHDKNMLSLSDWTARHNKWSDLEAIEAEKSEINNQYILKSNLTGDSRERTRYLKNLYYKLPSAGRAILYFIYRYIFRLGFLDGYAGLYFSFLQGFWFRMLVDAKIHERKMQKKY